MSDSGVQFGKDDNRAAEFSAILSGAPSTRVEAFLADTEADGDLEPLIAAEMASRVKQGEELDETEFRQRFPELEDSVSALLEQATADYNSSPEVPANDLKTLGDYQLIEVLGKGGMGIVYKAKQRKLNRIVALKTILAGHLANNDQIDRFRLEAEASARLDHPGIAPVFEIGEENGIVFYSMGFVDGESLAERLRANTLTPRDAAVIVKQLADAAAYAHQENVVHRDLKPGNVLLEKTGQPKITDFGLAKLVDRDDGVTVTGAVVGTPTYMSPEQALGDAGSVGPLSDVYSLGAILYASLCGHPPFRGPSTMATLRMVAMDRPTPLRQLQPDIPVDIETICHKCLEKDPNSRYSSATELAEELQRFLENRPIQARPVSTWRRFSSWCRRNPGISLSLTGLVATLLVGVIVSTHFAIQANDRAVEAEAGTSAAKQQTRVALNVAKSVVRNVQQKLKQIPEARETRRELLVDVLAELEQISRVYLDGNEIDLESALALSDLATLYTELGDGSGSDVRKLADDHYHRSADIFVALVDRDPKNVDYLQPAATALLNYGDISREYKMMTQAVWAHTHGRRIAKLWFDQEPTDTDAWLAYINASEALGEAMLVSGQREECEPFIEEAVEAARKFAAADENAESYDNLSSCLCTLGDMFRKTGRFDEAEAAYERMAKSTVKAMELAPNDPKYLNSRSCDFERLGDLAMARKNYSEALELYRKMMKYCDAYLADDPTNLYRLQQSTWGYQKLNQVHTALGNATEAAQAKKQLEEIRAKLAGR